MPAVTALYCRHNLVDPVVVVEQTTPVQLEQLVRVMPVVAVSIAVQPTTVVVEVVVLVESVAHQQMQHLKQLVPVEQV